MASFSVVSSRMDWIAATVCLCFITWHLRLFSACSAAPTMANVDKPADHGDCIWWREEAECPDVSDEKGDVAATFTMKPNASILDYLNPSLLEDHDAIMEMSENLKKGNLVVIENAFQPEFAEFVYDIYNDYNDSEWKLFYHDPSTQRPWYYPGTGFHYHIVEERKLDQERTTALADQVFRHPTTKQFLANLSGVDVFGEFLRAFPSLYRPDDYSNFHSDLHGSRAVTFLWQLSKDWDPSWGGAFYWAAGNNISSAYCHHSKFNTVLMFPVSATSLHSVTPVTPNAQGRKRLTYSGWFLNLNETLSLDQPLEDIYNTKEARKQLTNGQVVWLWYAMKEKKCMPHLVEAVQNEIVFPKLEEPVFVCAKTKDDSITKDGYRSMDDEDFKIQPESSILDYLRPTVVNDEETLSTIRKHLRQGHLVVIRDAFVPEFAEYVWDDISKEDFPLKHVEHVNEVIPGYLKRNWIGADNKSSIILNETMAVFHHPDTKRLIENLSGKDCSGHVRSNVEVYGPGDYSSPDNSWREDYTVKFVWSLSKDWDSRMGGSLFWAAAQNTFVAHQKMSFNTLFLFHVGATTSRHAISVVSPYAEEDVRMFSGHFTATIRTTSVNDPIEEWYATKEDRARLSVAEAEMIVSELNLEAVEDVDRKERLIEVQDAIRREILSPNFEDNVYVWKP